MKEQTPQDFFKFLEWVACDLCGQNNYKLIYSSRFTAKDFSIDRFKSFKYASADRSRGNIVQCRNCRLVYQTPRDRDVVSLYQAVDDDYYFSSKEDRIVTFERDLGELKEVIGRTEGVKKLLDIGCSYGFFMDVAAERGWEVYGCELSKPQFRFAQQRHPNTYNQELQQCPFQENYFDAVTLFDVIEHLNSPSAFLKQVQRVLKKDALLAIGTPDLSSWPAKIMGRYWINFIRMHFYYFTPETITKLLEQSGFKVVRVSRHKRIVKLGQAIQWMSKYPFIHYLLKFLFDNRWLKQTQLCTGLSGNMIVYAQKI